MDRRRPGRDSLRRVCRPRPCGYRRSPFTRTAGRSALRIRSGSSRLHGTPRDQQRPDRASTRLRLAVRGKVGENYSCDVGFADCKSAWLSHMTSYRPLSTHLSCGFAIRFLCRVGRFRGSNHHRRNPVVLERSFAIPWPHPIAVPMSATDVSTPPLEFR